MGASVTVISGYGELDPLAYGDEVNRGGLRAYRDQGNNIDINGYGLLEPSIAYSDIGGPGGEGHNSSPGAHRGHGRIA